MLVHCTSAIVQNLGNCLTRPCKAYLASKDARSGDRSGFHRSLPVIPYKGRRVGNGSPGRMLLTDPADRGKDEVSSSPARQVSNNLVNA